MSNQSFEKQYLDLIRNFQDNEITERGFWDLMNKVEPLYKRANPENFHWLREHTSVLSRTLYSFSNYGFEFQQWIPAIEATLGFMIEFLENSETRLCDLNGYSKWRKIVKENEKKIENLKGDPEFFRERMGF